MKSLLVLGLMAVSFSSHALVVARLTNINCISSDGQHSIEMKFDSSKSFYGSQVFLVDGNEISGEIRKGNEYRVLTDDSVAKFEMKDEKNFLTTMTIAKISEEDRDALDEDKDHFDFGGDEVQLDCKVDTKFRLR